MFFRAKDKSITEKSISATLYPNQIVILTRNKKDDWIWYSTDFYSIITVDTTDRVLTDVIFKHFDKSTQKDISHEEIKALRENFKRLSKFKTEKAIVDNAKYVNLYLTGDEVRFEPFKNKVKQKTFYRMPEQITSVRLINDEGQIGRCLRKVWENCIIE